MPEKTVSKKLSLIVTIVNRNLGQKVTKIFSEENLFFHFVCLGRGTASSDLLAYLGLGETEKDIVLSSAPTDQVPHLLEKLRREMHLDKPGNGVAFTVPISSVGGPITLSVMTGTFKDRKE